MVVTSSEAFYEAFFNALSFTPIFRDNFILYHNDKRPELGYIVRYTKARHYDIFLGNYTIPEDFGITFNIPSTHMRFGTVYLGETKFRLANEAVSSFKPSSFFVVENHPKGRQVWYKGQHFHGTEVTIYAPYFKEMIQPEYGEKAITPYEFPFNITHRYLPLELVKVLHQIERLASSPALNALYIDSKILECLAVITAEFRDASQNAFTNQYALGAISLGKNRKINLSHDDVRAIRKAYEIMTERACDPPTIEHLSELVNLNPQKLKGGFAAMYHSTIWEYANSIRMSIAANLLSTTDRSIEEIAHHIGYARCANFTNMFNRTYQMSPSAFRRAKR
ncbi:helix-turn-helix domain-containing protein [Cellulosilyticum sp. I15G10I2]|uniref:helix-turn-helix domain-containing protein n=1 Tax=Cellulosilyticum sp. I15G10I2 TaxID=1892843 RepID=UPI00085C652F|nr:AraC family transcriptional regulator [Cellulosilyticum sp. I15G10I2]